ncbi:thioredoxin domain-containing protein [Blastococcus sp. CT_GayMR16]|uniref:thioredoxin family protein n=1 Tax=Blastococcus sp. CT_GayMR16 TaxID=2559607 RepID=UPI00107332F8|nr:thioredoxin domain-containing protein [Blastococcus sp. CT_GayMR16]TFV90028.1 thiol reductase thioredoxin [Blastococcus sp. CT_GayMR16]
MSTLTLSADDFADAVLARGIVLVDFWSAARAACRALTPVLEAAAQRHPDVVFARVDADAEPDLPAAVGVRSIPTLMVFRDGVLVFAEPGVLPGDSLELLISTVRALDMPAVRELFPGR